MNKRKTYLSSLLFLSCWSFSAYASSFQAENAEGKEIEKVQVLVESTKDGRVVNNVIKTSLSLKEGGKFLQHDLDIDLKKLALEYDSVEPSYKVVDGKVQLIIKVWPRPIVGKIEWHGNKGLKTSKLQQVLAIAPGSTLNRKNFNEQFKKLQDLYLNKRYYEAKLTYKIDTDPKTGEAIIQIYIDEGTSGIIRHIVFEGVTYQEEQAIRAKMVTKEETPFTFLTGDGVYNQDKIAHDTLVTIQFLQNEGYASAEVSIEPEQIEGKKGKIQLIVKINKGELYHFGTIGFTGNSLLTNEQIESQIRIHEGEICSLEKVRKVTEAIQMLYGRFGYIDATAPADVDWVRDKNMCNVKFQIDEGGVYKIGMIHVVGNVSTQSRVILRESLLCPGETFDLAKLKATQSRLENVGYFKAVNVYAVRTTEDAAAGDNTKDVYIEVEESSTGSLSLFAGFSSSDDVSVGVDLAENNFNIAGIPRIFSDGPSALRGGGEFAHIRANFGVKQRVYTLSWMDPYFNESYWRVGFEVSETNNRAQSTDYHIDTTGFTTYASYPLDAYWTFGVKYRLRNSRFFAHTIAPRPQLPNETDEQYKAFVKAWEKKMDDARARAGITSGIGASLTFDATDSAWKPRNGLRSVFDSEYIGVGGKYTFFRLSQLNTLYKTLWPHGVFKARADMRYIVPVLKLKSANDVPISERFFLGGDSNVRGFSDYQIGPKLLNTNDPAGGISATLFSVEYLHSILPMVDLFAFCDAGSVSSRMFATDFLRISVGYGARIELMNNMPIVIGYGLPIQRREDDKIEKFFFSMGAQF